MDRRVERVFTAHHQREGGGFVVRRPFPSEALALVDPFLLLDELGPVEYAPGKAVGAPDHPHRGFETVSYILEGEIEHEDSVGNRGSLVSGDVQWMTAGRGIVHSERPTRHMLEAGGRMHGFQLWVNLPARDKMMAPRYQDIAAKKIPCAESADGRARVRVIAGEALGTRAVIDTRTPITYLDWTLKQGALVRQPIDIEHNAFVYVFEGSLEVGPARSVLSSGQLALLSRGDRVELAVAEGATTGARALLIAGQPLGEPVARYGPFVMNTTEEIHQAVRDFQTGKMGGIERT